MPRFYEIPVKTINVLVIQSMKTQTAMTDQLLQQWSAEKAALTADKERLAAQIQKDLQNNVNFKTWAYDSLPDNVVGLLSPSDNK
jgi:hypothetical protein